MKPGRTLFLRVLLALIGLVALVLLLVEPHLEGRNAHATLFEIYFKDPFLAYAYVASIPFFVGLYQANKALGYAGRNMELSPLTVRSVRTVRNCAIAIIVFVIGGEAIIMSSESDDRAGGVFIGALIAFASIVVGVAMALLERALRNAANEKPRSDSTA